MKLIIRITVVLAPGLGILFAPLLYLHGTADIRTPQTAAPVEAALVFGALVRKGGISPLHQQRLDAAFDLWQSGKAQRIVVSNAPTAAGHMRDYLLTKGMPEAVIEVDGDALHTPQTCTSEKAKGKSRSLAFISQTFHLPRLAFQCAQHNVTGVLITATPTAPSSAPLWTKIRVRSMRHLREAGLLWGAILSLYPDG
ncbi:MAG: ElyC/SanA/YdcF family protein [Planktomarina sp.]